MTTANLLALAGEMATAARNLVGGQNITIGRPAPASIYSVAALAEKLRDAVDAYDAAIMESMREGKT